MKTIYEIIVVEGRDDEAALKRAVDAEIITTHGYGINQGTFDKIQKAYEAKGIIIFTDPDLAGERIRKRLAERFPNAKHAYLAKEAALKDGDIGVENATPESIISALEKCRCIFTAASNLFSMEDLVQNDLVGISEAGIRRDKLGAALGIGYGNAKTFLSRLNHYGITKKEFDTAIGSLE